MRAEVILALGFGLSIGFGVGMDAHVAVVNDAPAAPHVPSATDQTCVRCHDGSAFDDVPRNYDDELRMFQERLDELFPVSPPQANGTLKI